jgi:hypothetical protein
VWVVAIAVMVAALGLDSWWTAVSIDDDGDRWYWRFLVEAMRWTSVALVATLVVCCIVTLVRRRAPHTPMVIIGAVATMVPFGMFEAHTDLPGHMAMSSILATAGIALALVGALTPQMFRSKTS